VARTATSAKQAEKAAGIAMLNDVRPLYPGQVLPGDITAADPTGTVTWYAVAAGRETGIFTSWAFWAFCTRLICGTLRGPLCIDEGPLGGIGTTHPVAVI
jgi:hypothetical protein